MGGREGAGSRSSQRLKSLGWRMTACRRAPGAISSFASLVVIV